MMTHALLMALENVGMMAWDTFWALVLGFAISAALQVFISKDQMSRYFGRADLRSVALATGFGAASSSCSYAAAAAARSAFAQGAALIPALAFMFASTNLVLELGAVVWLLLGWRFFVAEFVGAFVLIGLMSLLVRLIFPKNLEDEARQHVEGAGEDEGGCCHHHGSDDAHENHEHGGHEHHHHGAPTGGSKWRGMSDAFVMDWQMLWKEILIGFVIAGCLAAFVPQRGWQAMFLESGPAWVRLIENALVGPLIAVASFVCSVGNIPLASVLWSGGISFGGVLSFIYADLLVVPLIVIYRKYYGTRAAIYISVVFFTAMVGAGIIVDLLFNAFGLVPHGPRPQSVVTMHTGLQWNYTTWLNILAFVLGGWLVYLHLGGKGHDGNEENAHEHHGHDHHDQAHHEGASVESRHGRLHEG